MSGPQEATRGSRAGAARWQVSAALAALALLLSPWPAMARTDQASCEAYARGDSARREVEGLPVRIDRAALARVADREVCALEGRAAASTRFRLLLPLADWNGRYAQLACEGDCGVPQDSLCDEVVGRGHACLAMLASADAAPPPDGVSHALASVAGTLLERFYDKPAARRVFLGCGVGGHEALRLVQSHPSDFNGIVAGAPLLEPAAQARVLQWNRAAARGLTDEDRRRLHRGALAACDRGDGLADGLIGDPLRCRFDPGTLACAAPGAADCLSGTAIDAARRIYAGPPNPSGSATATAGLLPGSELEWPRAFAAASRVRGGRPAPSDAGSTDLDAFAAAGGKLILYQGLADARVAPRRTIRWFEDLARKRGGLVKAQATVRFFAVPGMGHCGGGEGATRIDFLAALETWVGQGSVRPPDDVVAFRVADATRRVHPFAPLAYDPAQSVFAGWMLGAPASLAQVREQTATAWSRPVFAYPVPTHYKGRGDPANWISFFAPADYTLQFDEVAR